MGKTDSTNRLILGYLHSWTNLTLTDSFCRDMVWPYVWYIYSGIWNRLNYLEDPSHFVMKSRLNKLHNEGLWHMGLSNPWGLPLNIIIIQLLDWDFPMEISTIQRQIKGLSPWRWKVPASWDDSRITRPGQHTKNDGKSPCLMGKSTISMSHFQQQTVTNYQRVVYHIIPWNSPLWTIENHHFPSGQITIFNSYFDITGG